MLFRSLLARALSSLEFFHDGRVAVMVLRRGDFDAAGGSPGDTGGFADVVRSVEAVRVVALLTEQVEDGATLTKVSMRSKGGPGMIDVNVVAAELGGGGHAQAAGARVRRDIDEVKARLVELLG